MNLQEMIDALPDNGGRTAESIDISLPLGLPEGTQVYTFREMTANDYYRAARDTGRLIEENPDWTDDIAEMVAIFGNSYVGDAGNNGPGALFARMANDKSGKAFMYLVKGYRERFPALGDAPKAMEDAKKK